MTKMSWKLMPDELLFFREIQVQGCNVKKAWPPKKAISLLSYASAKIYLFFWL